MFSKKKSLHLESISDSATFPQKSRCSLKKKRLHFDFISDFPIFLPKSRYSLKKKKGLHFDFIPGFLILFPKSRGSLKKKVFTSICCCIFGDYQNHGDLQKLKSKIPRTPLSPFATHRGIATPILKSPDSEYENKSISKKVFILRGGPSLYLQPLLYFVFNYNQLFFWMQIKTNCYYYQGCGVEVGVGRSRRFRKDSESDC